MFVLHFCCSAIQNQLVCYNYKNVKVGVKDDLLVFHAEQLSNRSVVQLSSGECLTKFNFIRHVSFSWRSIIAVRKFEQNYAYFSYFAILDTISLFYNTIVAVTTQKKKKYQHLTYILLYYASDIWQHFSKSELNRSLPLAIARLSNIMTFVRSVNLIPLISVSIWYILTNFCWNVSLRLLSYWFSYLYGLPIQSLLNLIYIPFCFRKFDCAIENVFFTVTCIATLFFMLVILCMCALKLEFSET